MRLIDADALMPNAEYKGKNDFVSAQDIANDPTIDAVPDRHGEWIWSKGDYKTCTDGWECSACKKTYHTHVPYFDEFNYCPNCGARMGERMEE